MRLKKYITRECICLFIIVCLLLPVTIFSTGCIENNQDQSVEVKITGIWHPSGLIVGPYICYFNLTNMEDHPLYSVNVTVNSVEVDGHKCEVSDNDPGDLGDMLAGETKKDRTSFSSACGLEDKSVKMNFLVTWEWKGKQSCYYTPGAYHVPL